MRYCAGIIGDTGHCDQDGRYVGFDYSHGLHLPFQHIPGVAVVAIADHDSKACEKGRAESGAQVAYADYREMLRKERLDVVAICSREGARHEEMILAAANAGCHIYVDKPFTTDLASADRIIATCDGNGNGVKIAVAHQGRYIEPFLTAKRMLQAGEIGRLVSMHGRVKEDHRGGGADVICCGVHITDLMRMFAGDPHCVFGYVTQAGRPITLADAYIPEDDNGLVAGDCLNATYAFDAGVVGHLTTLRDQHNWGERWGITLVGTQGVMSLRMFNDFCSASKLKISKARVAPEEAGPFEIVDVPPEPVVPGSEPIDTGYPPLRGNRLAVWDLLQAAEEGREPKASGRDGRWTLEMVHGVYASHLSGRRIDLPMANRAHPLGARVARDAAE